MKLNHFLLSFAVFASVSLPALSQTHNQPTAVDLGLSVQWSDTYLDAEMVNLANVGYYWASTTARKDMTQPNEEVPYNVNVGLNIANSNYDCVTAALGNGWRLPTKAECEELAKLSFSFGTGSNGKSGFTLKASNGNSIFIEYSSSDNTIGRQSVFWTADAYRESEESNDYTRAWACRISLGKKVEVVDMIRENKYLFIRPVKDVGTEKTAVTGVSLNHSEMTMNIDETAGLYAAVMPAEASDKRVSFTSSDESVATVDAKGRVHAVGGGKTTVTATALDGSGVSCTCAIDVISIEAAREIDLGLSVIWASYNLGAESMSDIGDYYQFANPEILTKWSITTSPYGKTEEIPVKNMAGTQYDPATKVFGERWMTPDKSEFQELYDNCDYETTDAGIEFTSKINGNKIFFPYTGFMYVSALNSSNEGCYMTAEIDKTSLTGAKVTYASFIKGKAPSFVDNPQAYKGYPIRAVKKKEGSGVGDIFAEDTADTTYDVYTADGRKVLSNAGRSSLSGLPSGLYILRSGSGRTHKVIL